MHALDLPELVAYLAPYLSQKSLINCIRVSQQWHDAFVPHLWSTFRVTVPSTRSLFTLSSLDTHAPCVRDICFKDLSVASDSTFFNLSFPYLQTLSLSFAAYRTDRALRAAAFEFLQRHQGQLRALSLLKPLGPMSEVTGPQTRSRHDLMTQEALYIAKSWELLHGCHGLRSLKVESSPFWFDLVDQQVLKIVSELETLSLGNVGREKIQLTEGEQDDSSTPSSSQGPRWTLCSTDPCIRQRAVRIRQLSLEYCNSLSEEYHLIKECHAELRSLKWLSTIHANVIPPMAKHLEEGMWPFLDSLELRIPGLQDKDLAAVLRAIGPLRKLNLSGTEFGPLSTTGLLETENLGQDGKVQKKHAARLEKLLLGGCNNLTGAMVQRFLCELPHLKEIHAKVLTDRDLENDTRPWVCQDLRVFHVGIALAVRNIEEDQSEISKDDSKIPHPRISPFMERLSALTRLESFHITSTRSGQDKTEGEFYLSSSEEQAQRFELQKLHSAGGLEQLKTLRHLVQVRMEYTGQKMTMSEAKWMVENWPRLESVVVRQLMTMGTSDHDVVRVFFGQHQIHYGSS
ncbi:hypothetical protein EMPS_03806 [Entomortierella parvispora]|uniref:F-box domain-containing protein n=1 Tax=Entomortierella parvispora TaxID=205924 RepID=A0A9P3LUS6_9FUNG|nr:hypothetical protein EMPS_03806 [Entomortierella parvispora]